MQGREGCYLEGISFIDRWITPWRHHVDSFEVVSRSLLPMNFRSILRRTVVYTSRQTTLAKALNLRPFSTSVIMSDKEIITAYPVCSVHSLSVALRETFLGQWWVTTDIFQNRNSPISRNKANLYPGKMSRWILWLNLRNSNVGTSMGNHT